MVKTTQTKSKRKTSVAAKLVKDIGNEKERIRC